ncbi:MAG: alcohol dehydrogenase catalytic domain-containing protein [Planctomycetota bacterium]|nr:alcohol dehydrogenase catalytic domain-containing protein [Planctomycetota bacterium]
MQKTSNAALFHGPGQPLELLELPLPQPGPGEILVQVEACTICGSDLHTCQGKRKEKTPTILGHEAIGRIIALGSDGEDQSEWQLGDRISWSVCVSCLDCSFCKAGFLQKCESLQKFGHVEVTAEGPLFGGFAEHVLLPPRTRACRVPPELDARVICPANCATATVMACLDRADNLQGKRVLILGMGLLGLTAAAICKARGATEIAAVDPDPRRLEWAPAFAANRPATSLAELQDSGDSGPFDLILELSGSTEAIRQSLPHLAIGGTMVLAGTVMPTDAIQLDPEQLVRRLQTLVGVHNYLPRHLEEAIDFLASQAEEFPFEQLVEKTFALQEINEAVRFAIDAAPVRVMIVP